MKNKLDKEYLYGLYETYEEDNMFYALTMLKSLGLTEWFKNMNIKYYYLRVKIDMLIKNIKFIDMFDLNKLSKNQIQHFVLFVDNGISYFNQEQLNKLDKYQISTIIKKKPELEKHLVNCKNYGKEIKGETFFYPH